MFRGMYNAVSGMQTAEKRLDAASNNMANANTTGYKRDLVITEAFPEVLISKINATEPAVPHSRNLEVQVEEDNEGFRLSTAGGFFAASTRTGISYNKTTAFARGEDGYLRTYERDGTGAITTRYGNPILDASGRTVQVENENFEIDNQGRVIDNGEVVANLVRRTGGNVIGTMNAGVRLEKFATDFTQGSLEQTESPLDLALEGAGFFMIYDPEDPEADPLFTRDGNFTLNDNGDIITRTGHFLASVNETSIMVDGEDFQVTPDGRVLVDGEVRDQIAVMDFANTQDLRKVGNNLYRFEERFEPEAIDFEGRVLQGFIENSNVEAVDQMVEMINVMRAYESNQRVVHTYDEMLQRAVNDIGRG
ncbi:MAG: flagellar hook-basal body protein [Tindallia sp. MSAO_Bac2]|nr:MAG: flagellar hook-basal body protein [Tindallia sp. MSAO_Bac2]